MSHRRYGRARLTEEEVRKQNLIRATPEQRRGHLVSIICDEWFNAWMYQTFQKKAQNLVAKADDEEVMAVLVQMVGSNRFSVLRALMDAHPDDPAKQPAPTPGEDPDRKEA